jgi:hypothetical protein
MPAHVARPKDGDSVRVIEKFIRDKYEHKRYIAKEKPPKVQNIEGNGERDERAGRKAAVTRQRPPPSEHGEAPPIPVKAAPAPAPSLIDFMDFSEEPVVAVAAPVVPTHAPPAVPAFMPSYVGFIDFGDFSSSVPAQTAVAEADPKSFSRFSSNEVPGSPVVPAKPTRSADAILSLFESVPPPPVVNNLTGMSSVTTSADGISSMGGMAPPAYGMNGGRITAPQGNMPNYGQPHLQQMPMQMQQGHYSPQMPMQMPMTMPMQQTNGMGQQPQYQQQPQYPQQYMQQPQQQQPQYQQQQPQYQQQQPQYQQQQQPQYQQQQQQPQYQQHQQQQPQYQQPQQQQPMRGMSTATATTGPAGFSQQQYNDPQLFNFGN